MAKGFEAPPGVQIAALQQKKTNVAMDLMRPGDGTPWEDRGSLGGAAAFVKTCVKSITSPALLLDHIRRPDMPDEAGQFAKGCAACWGLSALVHAALMLNFLFTEERGYTELSGATFFMIAGAVAAVVAVASYLLLAKMAAHTYYWLVQTELKNDAPRVLFHNLFCYSMGPSLLALLPVVGPPLALLSIYVNWCVAGGRRLYITWRGSIVAATLSMALVLIIAGAIGFLVRLIAGGEIEPSAPMGTDPNKPRVIQ